jgi:tetratricopeptide (TPR) repeat protein
VFGGSGKSKESFERPVAIDYQGSNIIVLDALLSQIMVFVPTEYCQTVLMAITAEYNGDFQDAYQKWGENARMNANFSYAYVGLGKIRFEDGKNKEAMEYFQYAGNRINYSKAKEKARQVYMTQAFPVLFILLALVIVVLFVSGTVKKVQKYYRERIKHGHETNS